MAVTRSSTRVKRARPSAAAASTRATAPPSKRKKAQQAPAAAKKARADDDSNEHAASSATNYYLFKSESESRMQNGHEMKFSIDDLQAEPNGTTHWDGVRNAEACKCMRDMKKGDMAFFYHSNTKKTRPSIVGVVRVVSHPYPDHTAFDKSDPHYDARSKADAPRWYMVDVQFVRKFQRAITLDQIKSQSELANMQLVKRSRISVQRVTPHEWNVVHALC